MRWFTRVPPGQPQQYQVYFPGQRPWVIPRMCWTDYSKSHSWLGNAGGKMNEWNISAFTNKSFVCHSSLIYCNYFWLQSYKVMETPFICHSRAPLKNSTWVDKGTSLKMAEIPPKSIWANKKWLRATATCKLHQAAFPYTFHFLPQSTRVQLQAECGGYEWSVGWCWPPLWNWSNDGTLVWTALFTSLVHFR